ARRLLGGSIAVTLSREASYRYPQVDLLHLRHPLVRFAVSEIEHGRGRLHNAFALGLERSAVLPTGRYVFALSVVEIPGYRPTIRLVCTFIEIGGARSWSSPEQTTPVVLELLENAIDCDPPAITDAELDEARARLTAAVSDLLGEWGNREQQLDHARREQ